MNNPPGPVLKMEAVSKVYEGDPPFVALSDVSLEVWPGETIAIIGPSGSGKSTLLHLLGCLDKPSGGEMYVGGKAVSKMGDDELALIRRKTIGFIFQAFNLAPTLSVFQNVELPLMISDADPEARRRVVERNLGAVGLTHKMRNLPSQLSGGQKQRVAIARSLANDPPILLADEPTGNLDSKSSDDVIQFILSLGRERGITVIFVTHDPRVAAHCERQIRILDGKIESDVRTGKGGSDLGGAPGRTGAESHGKGRGLHAPGSPQRTGGPGPDRAAGGRKDGTPATHRPASG